MTNKPIMAAPSLKIKEAAAIMKKHDIGSLLVSDRKGKLGIITEEDFVRKAVLNSMDTKRANVSTIMETDLITISPEKDIYDALILMKENNLRHLPVISKDRLVGLITLKDILKIQPELFDTIVEDIELREEHRKPIGERVIDEDICAICGKVKKSMKEINGILACPLCRKTL